MKKKKRLFWQLYRSYLLITLLALTAVTWYALSSFKDWYLEQKALDLETQALLLEKHILENIDNTDQRAIDDLCKKIGKRTATRITVILPKGEVVGDSEEDPAKMDNHMDRPEVRQAFTEQMGTSLRHSLTLDKDMMYTGIAVKKGDQIVAVIRTALPLTDINQAIGSIQTRIAVAGIIVIAFAALLSLLISRGISGPVEQLRRWAVSAASGQFRSMPLEAKTEELAALSDALNHMAIQLRDRIDAIVRQRNETRAMLLSMGEGLIAVDMEEKVLNMNPAAARLFSCDPDTAKGHSVQEVIRNIPLHQFVREALSSQEPVEKEISFHSGKERYLNCHGSMVRDPHDKQIGALVVLNDITHIRKLERIRSEFVANVSHEIRTPLTAIKGFVETLRDQKTIRTAETKRFLDIIANHVTRLENLIADLLSLSKIERETEQSEIIFTQGSVFGVLTRAIEVYRDKAEGNGITMTLSCPKDLNTNMEDQLLEQAVGNLLDNAIKYSDKGGEISVVAFRLDGEIAIHVRDSGRGISEEHLPRLFERFYRVDHARSRKLGGTGLGLAIVKHIAQAHGGRASVESTPGKGSTFTIHLPA